jgi:hypothetical protein
VIRLLNSPHPSAGTRQHDQPESDQRANRDAQYDGTITGHYQESLF